MKFIIHNGDDEHEDTLIIEANTIEEIQAIAEAEAKRRGWKDPWSEEIR